MARQSSHSPTQRIKDAMIAAQIRTPSQLARKMNLPRQTVHRWLSEGIDQISYKNLLRLADALNVNARWIMFGQIGRIKPPMNNKFELEAASIARGLPVALRSKWLVFGRNLLEAQGLEKKSAKKAGAGK